MTKEMRLTVLGPSEKTTHGRHGRKWLLCQCICGTIIDVRADSLQSGHTTSCGCLHVESARKQGQNNRTHGHSDMPEYNIWKSMIARCHRPGSSGYRYYGREGIQVCERWRGANGLQNFLADIGPRPSPELTIERRNGKGNYEPSNCYWGTRKEQMRNFRRNRFLTLGDKTQTIAAWVEETGISRAAIYGRLDAGWPIERILTEPIRKQYQNFKNKNQVPGR